MCKVIFPFQLSGSQFGTIIAFPVSGLISDQLGWPWVFYLQGGACFVWVLLWIICVTNTPAQHPWISKEEVRYIEDGLEVVEDHVKAPPIPWTHMFRSMPFWAIFVALLPPLWHVHASKECPSSRATYGMRSSTTSRKLRLPAIAGSRPT